MALLSAMDAAVKWLSSDYSTIQLMFFRSVFALLPLAPLRLRSGWAGSLRTRRLGTHALRSFFRISALGCFFWSLALLPLADATAIVIASGIYIIYREAELRPAGPGKRTANPLSPNRRVRSGASR